MNIWLINPHDAISGEPWGYKHGMILAETLAEHGHSVTYWASNFAHATKRFRCRGWGEVKASANLRILLVPVMPYAKHVSIRRIGSLWMYAWGVWGRSQKEPTPDCLIISMPTPFSDYVAVRLSKRYRAALITDFRDLWPEIFLTAFPKRLRGLGNVLLAPLYWSRSYAFKNSHAVTAVCKTYLDLAKKIAPSLNAKPQAIIYSTGVSLADFRSLMNASGGSGDVSLFPKKQDSEVWVTYAGTLGNNYDVHTLMYAALLLSQSPDACGIRIVIAGDGPLRQKLIDFVAKYHLGNLLYVGVLNMSQLCQLYAMSDIGLCIYAPESTVVIPAKAYDYYAAELPIISSVAGEFADYLSENQIGMQYSAGDANSLAEAILALAKDSVRREYMKSWLRQIAPRFDRDQQYSQIFNLLPQNTGLSMEKQ